MELLIAEDDKATRLLLTNLAQQWGYEVIAVKDGAAAWDVMRQDDAPRLVLMDWEMPKMTGLEVCERIRNHNSSQAPYILMLTARSYTDDIAEGLPKGANDYMLKPLDKDEFKMRLGIGSRVLQTQLAANSDGELDYKMLFEESVDAFLLYKDGRYVDCNQSAVDMLGCKNKEELLGTAPANFSAQTQPCGQASSEKAADIIALAMERGNHRFEWDHKRANGEVFPAEVLLTAVPMGAEKGLHITCKDISHSKDQQEKLKLLAHYDVLTQLPNRTLFSDRFKQAVAYSKRTKTLLAVCFVDLDDFKPINDNYGHEIGDQILIEVDSRIKLSVREGDTVSRQGGDEFTLLLGGLEHHTQAKQILERMLSSLSEPYFTDGCPYFITASCGASIHPGDETELEMLVRQADQAMYQAKQGGKNKFSFYDHDAEWV